MSFIQILMEFMEDKRKYKINTFAASTAFFFFLSLVPILILICTIMPYTPISESFLLEIIEKVMSNKVSPFMESLIHEIYAKSAGILSVAAIVTLWSAGKGVLALMQGLNTIQQVDDRRNYFLTRIVASFYTLCFLIIVIVSLVFLVFGQSLVNGISAQFPEFKDLGQLIMNIKLIPIIVFITLVFAAVYAYVPNQKHRISNQLPGAFFAAAVWCMFSYGFSLYVEYSDFSIYGSLAIIILVMLWLYFCMYIILFGAYLNRYFIKDEWSPRRMKGNWNNPILPKEELLDNPTKND